MPFTKTLLASIFLLLAVGCNGSKKSTASEAVLSKIKFSLDDIDEDGRYGPADGKRLLDYEFCIPKTLGHIDQIKKINPAIQMPEGSSGRINCPKSEQLCLGNTGQEDWKGILLDIARQDFVQEIRQNFYE